MVNTSEGLTPTLRPALGVGWNRALPAPFGFENAFKGDDVNDHFTCPRMSGATFPMASGTLEFWLKYDGAGSSFDALFYMGQLAGGTDYFSLRISALHGLAFNFTGGTPASPPTLSVGQKYHMVLVWSGTSCRIYVNGVQTGVISPISNLATTIGTFYVGRSGNDYSRSYIDEVRLYTRALALSDITVSYNNGFGNNPPVTEFLMAWYQFNQFEMLDFSAALDGSVLATGVRDASGNNYHLRAFNMDTNPVSANYVLKPF